MMLSPIMNMARPNLSFAVNQTCQHLHNPLEGHMHVVKCIFKYLKGTVNVGLQLDSTNDKWLNLEACCDSDWGGSVNRKSIT